MTSRALRYGAVVLACLLASACKDRHEPIKPITFHPRVLFVDA